MSSVLILDKVLPVSFLSSILDNNIRRHPRGSDVQIRQNFSAYTWHPRGSDVQIRQKFSAYKKAPPTLPGFPPLSWVIKSAQSPMQKAVEEVRKVPDKLRSTKIFKP
jgi:hypothetical protein